MFGRDTPAKLEKERQKALSHARRQRIVFENMIYRCRAAGETPDPQVISDFSFALDACEQRMKEETDIDEFNWLAYQAGMFGQLRAYLCPLNEIYEEGGRLLDLLEDWGFADANVKRLRGILEQNCKEPERNPEAARGSLRSIMHEVNVSEDYLEQFEDDVRRLSWILLAIVAGSLLFSVVALLLSQKLALLFPLALLIAGVAGSCASVLARMPISEVSSTAVSTSMERTIFIRVGTGMTASVVGCALLSWGLFPISIDHTSFAEVLNACAPTSTKGCTPVYSLIVLAVPILFGFSERILTTLEDKLLGNADSAAKR